MAQPRDDKHAPAHPRRARRVRRWFGVAGLAFILLLLVARARLPSWLQGYVNRTLDQNRQYDGQVGEIDVSLWRGAYSIQDIKIVRTNRAIPVPFFEARQADFALDWSALLSGQLRGRIVMDRPKLNFVHGRSREETQTGVDEPWLQIIKDLFPFRIDKAEVHDGEIHFHAFHTEPRVNIYLSEIQATLTNLTNVEDKLDPLMAQVTARGTAMNSGRFQFDMTLDPQSHRPSFNLATQLLDLDVARLNPLTRAYGDFDFESGRFDFVVELSAKDGFLDGYAKPLFRDLHVLGPRDVRTDDPLEAFWEALVGLVSEVFKNQPRNQFGTRFTLEGELDDPRTNILEIVGNVLRNAFVQAYLPRIEGRIAPDAADLDSNEDE